MTTFHSNCDQIILRLPFLPTSTNRAWRTFRGKWVLSQEYAKFKKRVAAEVLRLPPDQQRITWPFCRVTVYLFPATTRKIDVDNRNKTLFDALTFCRFWPDDDCVTATHNIRCRPVKGGATVVFFDRDTKPFANIIYDDFEEE